MVVIGAFFVSGKKCNITDLLLVKRMYYVVKLRLGTTNDKPQDT